MPGRRTVGLGTLYGVNAVGGMKRYDVDHRVMYSDLPNYGKYVFVVNENVHQTGRRLRGLMVATWDDIGYIIKANGTKAIYQAVLPSSKPLRLISLYDPNVQPIEQVYGPCLWGEDSFFPVWSKENPCIAIDRHGPSRFNPPPDQSIPVKLLQEMNSTSFENDGDFAKTMGKTFCPELVNVIYVLCTRERRRWVDKGANARRFTLPYGGLVNKNKWYVLYMLLCVISYMNSPDDVFMFTGSMFRNSSI